MFIFQGKDPGFASRSNEGADGIKCIGQAEGKDRDQYKRNLGGIPKKGQETGIAERCAERLGKLIPCLGKADGFTHFGYAEGNAGQGGDNNANNDSAFYFFHKKNRH